MKWTFVHINHINDIAGWQVPDILRDGNIRYFEDALTALQFAEYKCAQYNKYHPEMKKVPVINSQFHFQKMAELEIGTKAKIRLGLDSNVKMPVRNIFVLKAPDDAMFVNSTRAFGMIVKNGETQSVMSRDDFRGEVVPSDMRWTNLSVLELKKRYGYPINTFFPAQEREGAELTTPTPPPLQAFTKGFESLGMRFNDIATNISSTILGSWSMRMPYANTRFEEWIPSERDEREERYTREIPPLTESERYISFDMALAERYLADIRQIPITANPSETENTDEPET